MPSQSSLRDASSPKGGASGEEAKLSGMPRPPLGRGGGSASALTERLSPAVAHGQALLRTTSQSGLRPPAPLVGEPLAKPFTLRGMPKPPLGRGNGDDRRQWRKQGGAVGAAASRMQATAKQTLGAATRAVALRSNDGEVIPLFCKNPLQTSPRCGIIHLAASPLRIEYLPL